MGLRAFDMVPRRLHLRGVCWLPRDFFEKQAI